VGLLQSCPRPGPLAPASRAVAPWGAAEFRILGTLEVTDGVRSVDLHRPKPLALLAMLLLHPNQVVSADRLIDALWANSAPRSAANTLQSYVCLLRHVLAPLSGGAGIRTHATGYILAVDAEQIDAQRFERLVVEGRDTHAAGDARRAAEVLGDALALWRGPALADFAYDRFADVEAARLDALRLAAVEEHAQAELALGRHAQLTCRLQPLVENHPLREPLWAMLMLALYRCGRQAEALRAFQSAKLALREELGIDPCPALRRMEADILAQAPALEWAGDAAGPAHPAPAAPMHPARPPAAVCDVGWR
jgi:DNA-binding SARP family transcriptional activator